MDIPQEATNSIGTVETEPLSNIKDKGDYDVRVYVTKFWKINHFVVHETIRIFMFNLVLP